MTHIASAPDRSPRPPPPAALRYGIADQSSPAVGDARRIAGIVHEPPLWLRSIVPADEPALQRLFSRLTPTEIRRRFLYSLGSLPTEMARRLCTPDGQLEQALVIADSALPGQRELHGVGRMFMDDHTLGAEFALLVERSHAGLGLGRRLLLALMASARNRGMRELWSHVAYDNTPMLRLARSMGGEQQPVDGDPGVVRVRIALSE